MLNSLKLNLNVNSILPTTNVANTSISNNIALIRLNSNSTPSYINTNQPVLNTKVQHKTYNNFLQNKKNIHKLIQGTKLLLPQLKKSMLIQDFNQLQQQLTQVETYIKNINENSSLNNLNTDSIVNKNILSFLKQNINTALHHEYFHWTISIMWKLFAWYGGAIFLNLDKFLKEWGLNAGIAAIEYQFVMYGNTLAMDKGQDALEIKGMLGALDLVGLLIMKNAKNYHEVKWQHYAGFSLIILGGLILNKTIKLPNFAKNQIPTSFNTFNNSPIENIVSNQSKKISARQTKKSLQTIQKIIDKLYLIENKLKNNEELKQNLAKNKNNINQSQSVNLNLHTLEIFNTSLQTQKTHLELVYSQNKYLSGNIFLATASVAYLNLITIASLSKNKGIKSYLYASASVLPKSIIAQFGVMQFSDNEVMQILTKFKTLLKIKYEIQSSKFLISMLRGVFGWFIGAAFLEYIPLTLAHRSGKDNLLPIRGVMEGADNIVVALFAFLVSLKDLKLNDGIALSLILVGANLTNLAKMTSKIAD